MGLLCACGVRRIKDLLRVCLYFSSSLRSFSSSLSVCLPFVLPCSSSGCLLLVLLPCLSFPALALCFLFPLRMYTDKKKGRKGLSLASSLRGLWVFRFLCSY